MNIKKLNAPIYVTLLLAITIAFTAFIFPHYQNQVDAIAGQRIALLDTQLSYTLADVNQHIELIGDEGVAIMEFITGRLDMIYPLFYAGLFFIILFNLTLDMNRYTKWVGFLPILAATFDYTENFSILRMYQNYPNISNAQLFIAQNATRLKWLFLLMAIIAMTALSIYKARHPQSNEAPMTTKERPKPHTKKRKKKKK